MKIKSLLFLIACILLFFGGCAVKESDTMPEKVLKHTVNAPVYVVFGAGMIASEGSKAAITAICAPPYMAYKYLTKDINTTDNNITDKKEADTAAAER